MATSGVTALNLTARDVISFALRKLGTMPIGTDLDINEIEPVLLELNMMLKGWETSGPHLWRNTDGTLALTDATQSYSLATDNPLRIVEARYQYPDGHILPLRRMTRLEYMRLPVKDTAGIPTSFYFDPQRETQTLYLWPVVASVTTDAVLYTYQRRFQICVTLDDSLDIPEEWLQTVGYSLASIILPNYGLSGKPDGLKIAATAAGLIKIAKNFDRPSKVKFVPEYRPRGR